MRDVNPRHDAVLGDVKSRPGEVIKEAIPVNWRGESHQKGQAQGDGQINDQGTRRFDRRTASPGRSARGYYVGKEDEEKRRAEAVENPFVEQPDQAQNQDQGRKRSQADAGDQDQLLAG